MKIDVHVRPARPDESAVIADIHTRSRSRTYRGLLSDDYLDRVMPFETPPMWVERFAEFATQGGGAVFVAEQQGEVIAFVCVIAPDADGSALVNNLHAHPERKGRGAGSALLARAQAWARERGARSLHLHVVDGNDVAAAFYVRRGWRFTGTERDTTSEHPWVKHRYELAPA